MFESQNDRTIAQRVRVFGSVVLRVAPDTALIIVSVSRTDPKPEKAFALAHQSAQAVGSFLHEFGIQDFGSSRVTLSQDTRFDNGERRSYGYQAKIGFHVTTPALETVDSLLSGLIAAGANDLSSVTFQTSQLRTLRAEARRRAVVAAREKGELYCAAAGVRLGRVVSIEDVNPESVSGRSEGHTFRDLPDEIVGSEAGALGPGAISVTAAVIVTYRLDASEASGS